MNNNQQIGGVFYCPKCGQRYNSAKRHICNNVTMEKENDNYSLINGKIYDRQNLLRCGICKGDIEKVILKGTYLCHKCFIEWYIPIPCQQHKDGFRCSFNNNHEGKHISKDTEGNIRREWYTAKCPNCNDVTEHIKVNIDNGEILICSVCDNGE